MESYISTFHFEQLSSKLNSSVWSAGSIKIVISLVSSWKCSTGFSRQFSFSSASFAKNSFVLFAYKSFSSTDFLQHFFKRGQKPVLNCFAESSFFYLFLASFLSEYRFPNQHLFFHPSFFFSFIFRFSMFVA